ncbi:thioesterase II family protein [Bacterioplanoides sp.]|uniref:thioesterase II family protein n=1 Tax=Bacterioplanoides sp. TaxID=2066072 RepID=UPI003B58DB98
MINLFCFPFAGGASNIYRTWEGNLPKDVRVVALDLPGRGRYFGKPLLSTMDEVVNHFICEVKSQSGDGINVFFGHSMGAIVAYEVAKKLQSTDDFYIDSMIVSGHHSPFVVRNNKGFHKMTDKALIAELRRLGGTPEAVLKDRDLLELFLPNIRADFKVLENYLCDEKVTLDIPLFVCRGEQDPEMSKDQMKGWEDVTSANVSYREFSGDHFYLTKQDEQLFDWIYKCLSLGRQPDVELSIESTVA